MRTRPNILFILSDQHARHVAGCYGDPLGATPVIDRLAARGLAFDAAYSPSPICVPARMSLLTARHPHAQSCWANDDYLASDIPTMAHALGAAGYAPALIGRLHSLGPDQLHGFVHREIGDHSPNWIGIPRHNLGVLAGANDPEPRSLAQVGPGQSAYALKDVDVTRAACAWLDREAASRHSGKTGPFALFLGYMLPHAPYVAWAEDYARFAGRVGPARLTPPAAQHPWLAWWRRDRGAAAMEPAKALAARTAYYALTWRLDALIGEVIAKLEACGLAENTMIVYASDHGDQIGERGLWWKHTFYEESIAVPLILSWPGVLPAGERRKQVVSLLDLAQTVLEAAGAPLLPNAAGRSFLEVARRADAPWSDLTFAEYCTDAVPYWTGGMAVQQRMVREGAWKLIYYHGYAPQLFDLAADPDECVDRAADPTARTVLERLLALALADWNPEEIAARMRRRRVDKDLIGAWGRATHPADQYLWPLSPDQNRLEAV